mmetsp:Transcript_27548/g.62443  ORF Transcript_27548/g.62443 Transcript_27548/m.62443 type:complete len:243 (+) Transcript_27548:376-1104(+)
MQGNLHVGLIVDLVPNTTSARILAEIIFGSSAHGAVDLVLSIYLHLVGVQSSQIRGSQQAASVLKLEAKVGLGGVSARDLSTQHHRRQLHRCRSNPLVGCNIEVSVEVRIRKLAVLHLHHRLGKIALCDSLQLQLQPGAVVDSLVDRHVQLRQLRCSPGAGQLSLVDAHRQGVRGRPLESHLLPSIAQQRRHAGTLEGRLVGDLVLVGVLVIKPARGEEILGGPSEITVLGRGHGACWYLVR